MSRIRKSGLHFVVACSLLLVVASCSVNPATGKRQLNLIPESQEIAMGREADGQIVAQMGLYPDEGIQVYVQELGQSLAALSERPHLPWTFRVLDDPIVNAFALPGGFVYVTRGIMAHLNNEAELVGVLGHEIGHVTGRHGVNRLSKAQLLGVGLGVGMVLSEDLARFGDLAQSGLGLLFLKYSRDDERQADDLGLRYSVLGGYDAREMPGVFGVLRRVGEASGSGRVPAWMATHPDPGEREARIGQQLAAMDRDFSNATVNRGSYMGRLEGMVFGANPRNGYFEDGRFLHPELAFQLDFPSAWKTQNLRESVTGVSEAEDAVVQLTLAAESDLQTAMKEFLDLEGIEGGRVENGRVGGLPAVTAGFEAAISEEETVRGRVSFLRYGDGTYRLLGYTLEEKRGAYERPIDRFLRSFARVTDRAVLEVQPARVDVINLRRSLPLQSFQTRYPSSVPLEIVALINHIDVGGSLPGAGSSTIPPFLKFYWCI